jgi:hypothetical protein
MYISELTRRLCTQDLYPFVLQNKKKLAWTVHFSGICDWVPGSDEVVTSATLRAVWKYIEKFGSLPAGAGGVKDYVISNPDYLQEFSQGDEGRGDSARVTEQLDLLKGGWEPPVGSLRGMDTLVLLEKTFSKVRGTWHSALYDKAGRIANGLAAFEWREGKDKKEERGPAAAMKWLRMQWTKDFADESPPVDGFLHENMQAVREGFSDRMDEKAATGRFALGIEHLDSSLMVGRQALRFIGIVGQAGDGKTSLANFIAYNWLKQGANGLYVSTEHTPRQVWDAMTYLHSTRPEYEGRILPIPKAWDDKRVTPADIEFMRQVTFDLENRRNLPGKLEVKEFPSRDWDTIADWMAVYNGKNRYDFLVLDYITRMEIPGDPRWKDQGMRDLIHRIQKMTRNFDEARGLMVVSPVQITKESYKEAMKGDFKEGQGHYTLEAIRTYSELKDDMDLILTVWSDSDMKTSGQIEVACIKKREGRQPPAVTMTLQPTGAFTLKDEDASGERIAASAQAVAEVRVFGDLADDMPQY